MVESLRFKRPDIGITYLGSGKIEKELAKKQGVAFYELKIIGMPRKASFRLMKFVFYLFVASIRALRFIKKQKADAVFASGGYVSFPACLAAVILKKPLFLHEQNATLGLVNRLFFRYATTLFQSLPFVEESSCIKNRIYSGNPVRREINRWTREEGAAFFGLDPGRKTVFVFGGSQGSKKINETLLNTLKLLDSEIEVFGMQVIHAIGEKDFNERKREADLLRNELKNIKYFFFKYLDEIGAAYAASDLVICRAGATTIAELIAASKPSILIPYPYATEDHQTKNAQVLAERGAAIIIKDEELDASVLKKMTLALITNKYRISNMVSRIKKMSKPDASDEIASYIISALEKSKNVPLKE